MLNNLYGLVYFLVSLGIIVLIHELGHLVVAKRNNIHCYEFSIGMGPRIIKFFTDKKGTEYSLRAIPLGGYVQMAGESTDDFSDKYQKVSTDKFLSSKSPFVRFKVLIAGSTMNMILTAFIFLIIGISTGLPSNSNIVKTVEPELVTEQGVEQKITINKINGESVSTFDEISPLLVENNLEIEFLDENQNLKTATIAKTQEEVYSIDSTRKSGGIVENLLYAIKMPFMIIFLSILSLYYLFTGVASVTDLSGPIGIYSMSSDVANYGIVAMLGWIGFLSASIGFTNLLPIPGLDGGHLMFVYYEMITKKKASQKFQEVALTIGMVMLLGLFAFTVINDTIKVFQ